MADWSFSTAARRYRDAQSGRFLSASASVDLRNHYLEMQRQTMASLAQRVSAGDLTVGQWETAMRAASRETFTTAYAYGRGGRAAMTPADRAQLGELITAQHQYLSGFAADLAGGEMSAAQVEARAALYANAGVLANAAGEDAAWAGSDYQEINRLGSGDPCTQCPDLSALGWVQPGTLPRPGMRLCKANCHCRIERRVKVAAAESQRLRVVA